MTTTPLTEQQLDEITESHPGDWYSGEWRSEYIEATGDDESEAAYYRVFHVASGAELATLPDWAGPIALFIADAHDTMPLLVADLRRARDRVAELEAYAYGCDAEGCVLPHSSWCDAAKKTAAANEGCTCGKPWTGHPQPHAMHCWTVNPPRAEVEEMRKRIAELTAPTPASAPLDASHSPAGDRDGETGAEGAAGRVGDSGAAIADRLEAVLTERFTELGNPYSRMSINFQGPDGWPASKEVGPHDVAEVLRELLAATEETAR